MCTYHDSVDRFALSILSLYYRHAHYPALSHHLSVITDTRCIITSDCAFDAAATYITSSGAPAPAPVGTHGNAGTPASVGDR